MKSVVDKWNGFWRLTGFERGIVIESAVALTATWVGLRLAGFRRWSSALSWAVPSRVKAQPSGSPAFGSAQTIAHAESAAARNLPFHSTCLERSMVLQWLLRSRGIPAELRVGAQKQAERFEAHAWVECEGVVLSDADEVHVHFVPFDGPIVSTEPVPH